MPTNPSFWKAVRRRLGSPASKAERQFIESLDLDKDYESEFDDEGRLETVSYTVGVVQKLRVALRQLAEPDQPQTVDGRWRLLASLTAMHELAHGDATGDTWQPVQIAAHKPTFRGLGDTFVPTRRLIQVTFDHRLSLSALTRALRAEWPKLRRRGWVRRSRPLGARALALLRFVCLEAPLDATWRQRLSIWNERVQVSNPKWRFRDARRFCAAFRRAEMQLTGERYGLDWFYNSSVMFGQPQGQFDPRLVRAARDASLSYWREEAGGGVKTPLTSSRGGHNEKAS